MDKIIEVLSNADWVTILAFLGVIWIYNNRMDRKLDKIEVRLESQGKSVEEKMISQGNILKTQIDKLDEKITSQGKSLEEKMISQGNTLKTQIDKLEQNLQFKIDKIDEKITDVDRRLCRLEGAFSSKDCCMLKEDRMMKGAGH